jgi:acetyl-CoA carboxylase biotin carboxyl carrier protein
MDIKHIKSLIALMVENDLSKLELQEGDTHILIRRGQPPVVHTVPAAAEQTESVAPAGCAPVAETPPPRTTEMHIRSPMVGTFYSSPDPESPAFVKIGDLVEPDTVVCLVEAMKVFNEIKAEVSGRVTKVLVSNAEAVEYDQPLFVVEPL